MRRWVAPVFALVVLLAVVFGFVVLAAIGRTLTNTPAPAPWQAFALPGVLGVLALVLVGGTLFERRRARRR